MKCGSDELTARKAARQYSEAELPDAISTLYTRTGAPSSGQQGLACLRTVAWHLGGQRGIPGRTLLLQSIHDRGFFAGQFPMAQP